MIFGDRLTAAADAAPAAWLTGAVSLTSWTVGGLLPDHFERYLLIEAAPADIEDWWDAQREIVATLAEVLARFTDTPDESWFAIWEGHGFDEADTEVPRFALPLRTYYLVKGRVIDVEAIRWPGEPDRWFRPDLWWPQDRAWFVGTDVDFWCNYVGGSRAMTEAVASRLPDLCRPVTLDEPLRVED